MLIPDGTWSITMTTADFYAITLNTELGVADIQSAYFPGA
jgi:hypothetical protein